MLTQSVKAFVRKTISLFHAFNGGVSAAFTLKEQRANKGAAAAGPLLYCARSL
jgi:hypothetical protein